MKAAEYGIAWVKSESRLSALIRYADLMGNNLIIIFGGVSAEYAENLRRRFKGVYLHTFEMLLQKDAEHADVCADIKNTVAGLKRNSMSQIDLVDKDFLVNKFGFGFVELGDFQTAWSFEGFNGHIS